MVIPHALQQSIVFKEGLGPKCYDFNINKLLETKEKEYLSVLTPIYSAIKKTKKTLSKDKSLIAFVGAPWTLIIYLYNLKKKDDLNQKIKIENKAEIKLLLKKLDEFLKLHITCQVEAGADIIQIFDSWAGLIEEEDLEDYCYNPNKSLISFCKENNIPSICFPKGLKSNYKNFIEKVKPNAISIDYEVDPLWAKNNLNNICIQGGMSPKLLLKSEKQALEETDRYLEIFKNIPYIFNLGHGILPGTNPEVIKKIVDRVKLNK